MKIIQLEYFCAVCRYHSITQAAQKLYVTQPAISNAIRELEKEFSVSLFSRTKNHIVLTKEGEAFYQKASVLLDNIHETTSKLYDLGKQVAPILLWFISYRLFVIFRVHEESIAFSWRYSI